MQLLLINLQCDKRKPACSQCIRVSAECHGYRNPSDIIFRNYGAPAAAITARESHIHRSIPTLDSNLVPCIFHQYFQVEDIAFGHALRSCLPENIFSNEQNALSMAVASIGYALLSNLTKSPEKLFTARRKYGIAVRWTFVTVQNGKRTETCAVILVIFILALFEVRDGSSFSPLQTLSMQGKSTYS